MPEVDNRGLTQDIQALTKGSMQLPKVLRKMGYSALRKGQDTPISCLLAGRDTICVLPTATGKTAVFVIPSLCHGWKTLVVSPLVALMRDQVHNLWKMGIDAGYVNSLQTPAENNAVLNAWMKGELQFMYVAPERIGHELFERAIELVKPDHVVVDECHCISQWSHTFRPSYMKIGELIAQRNPKVVSAFTATCPAEVEEDVRRVLGIPNAELCKYYPRRTNLKLSSRPYTGKVQIADICSRVKGSIIVYCTTVLEVQRVYSYLERQFGDEVITYHGQLKPEDRRRCQDMFMQGKARIVIATNAFGMGIDKPDIRAVIHRDIPGTIEQLAQEVGRAGRDGKDSQCISLMDQDSLRTQYYFIEGANPGKRGITSVYETLKRSADGRGLVRMSNADIARISGVSDDHVNSSLSALVGSNVISRTTVEDRIGLVRILNPESDNKRFIKAMDLVEEGGVPREDGFLEIDLAWLSTMWGISEESVVRNLRQWDKDGLLSYSPPFTGKVTQILGDLKQVDFALLKKKEAADYAKLQSVVDYYSVPDDQKHEYLETYFSKDDREQ